MSHVKLPVENEINFHDNIPTACISTFHLQCGANNQQIQQVLDNHCIDNLNGMYFSPIVQIGKTWLHTKVHKIRRTKCRDYCS